MEVGRIFQVRQISHDTGNRNNAGVTLYFFPPHRVYHGVILTTLQHGEA